MEHPGHAGNAKVAVGGVPGLVLQIRPAGGWSWLLRTSVGGRRQAIGLGNDPAATLARAREKSVKMLDLIRERIDRWRSGGPHGRRCWPGSSAR